MRNEAPAIVFDDGAAYERFMGAWSRKVGKHFLEWIYPQKQIFCGYRMWKCCIFHLT